MVINLKQIFEITGEKQSIDCSVSAQRLMDIKGYSFNGPVTLKGAADNHAGIVSLNYTLEFVLNAECDRCLREFERKFCFEFEHILVKSLNTDNDEYVVCENEKLDLDELAVNDMLLQMPTKLLCKEDCKGLCTKCGADLNVSDCSCN